MNYLQLLHWVAPETIVLIGALAVLATDLLVLRDSSPGLRRLLLGLIAGLACAVGMAWTIAMPQETVSFAQMLSLSPVSQVVKAAILLLAITTVLLSIDSVFSPHCGEYLALVLMAAIGMMFLVSSENLLLIFVSLEFTSLSLYILAGFDKSNAASAESALKYFLFGGMSAAFTLFGLSLLYGLSGSIYLPEIAAALHGPRLDPLLAVGLVMTVIGFGFKIAAVPFHLWAPDVYQGAPIPSAGFIASGSKVASFFVFAKVMWVGFAGVTGSGAPTAYVPGWVPMLALVAAVSILLGNLAAIVQTSVRRLLAYSAIAHAGYMLLGLLGTNTGMPSLLY
ncbi:MAG TPA: NADH-quinone oxidoreductase subunit N, partial [Clostridia bacterium]|nr:NADH-quinone oxidoreductase subunit N [Clostridia bacterium]